MNQTLKEQEGLNKKTCVSKKKWRRPCQADYWLSLLLSNKERQKKEVKEAEEWKIAPRMASQFTMHCNHVTMNSVRHRQSERKQPAVFFFTFTGSHPLGYSGMEGETSQSVAHY